MATREELLVLARQRRLPGRIATTAAAFSPFTPWWAQRCAVRSGAKTRVVVAGRQVGKSLAAAFAVLKRAFERPRSDSAVLAPTYKIAETAIQRLRDVGLGIRDIRWKEQKKRFELPNGAKVHIFSADRKESVRGLAISGTYWIDEGAYVPEQAYTAGLPALTASGGITLVTTTPAGKNWVWEEFNSKEPNTAQFRFRSDDSPHTDKVEVARQRKKMTVERAAQEFDAVFVDDLLLAFPNCSRLFVRTLPERTTERDLRNVLGVDLGKEQDFVVVTLMNRHGEARILGRWRHVQWPRTQREIVQMARAFQAMVVVDHGAGGGYGGVLKDYLEGEGVVVLPVKTAVMGEKARIVEQCRADVQWERIKVLEGEHADQLRHELTVFQGIKRLVHGQEVMAYEGPQLKDEHDDCVVSLCLANWGRVHGWAGPQDETEDFAAFARANELFLRRMTQFPRTLGLGGWPGAAP